MHKPECIEFEFGKLHYVSDMFLVYSIRVLEINWANGVVIFFNNLKLNTMLWIGIVIGLVIAAIILAIIFRKFLIFFFNKF